MRLLIIFICLFPYLIFSQDILISQGGTVNTCSGNFYDSGGPPGSGNSSYGNNELYYGYMRKQYSDNSIRF